MKRALVIVVVAASLLALSAADLAAAVRPGPIAHPGPLTRARQFGFRVANDSNLITILPTPQAVISGSFTMTGIVCNNCGTACPPFPRTVVVTLQATADVPAGYSVTAMDATNYTVTSAVQNTAAALSAGDFVTLTITGDVGNCLSNFQVWFDMGDDECGDLPDVFVNELLYDPAGTDAGEAIEVAGPAGTDLEGWSIVLYNGSGGASYNTAALSGVIPDQGCGFGTAHVTYASNGIQNGAPDGIALIDGCDRVVQFLSYEGTFTATNGLAVGTTSTDIGVLQDNSSAAGASLQLTGEGSSYSDFTWGAASVAGTFSAVNTGQSFCDLDPYVASTSPADEAIAVAVNANVSITFSENVTVTGDWFDITCTSGNYTAGVTGGPRTYVLDPDFDFAYGDDCTVIVEAASVSDQDGTADNMAADHSFNFTAVSDLAPTVASTVPANSATNVALAATITINFSEDVTFDGTSYGISCATSGAHTAGVSGSGSSYVLTPVAPFNNGELCTVTVVGANVTDLDGVATPMAADHVFSFTTVYDAAPTVVEPTSPANGATGVALAATITINFSENVTFDGTSYGISCATSGAHAAGVSGSGSSYTLTPAAPFVNGELCTVTVIAANVTDTDTADPYDAMAADHVFNFTTVSAVDLAPTVVEPTSPADGATGVLVDANITIDFSEEVAVTGTWFGITCGAGTTHTATASSSPASTYTLNPATNFANGVSCTVTVVAANVADTDGAPNTMAENYSFSFATVAGGCYLSGVVISQVYGAGGNAGATYKNDFVELHNRGNTAVSIDGWSLQYASATGNFGTSTLRTSLTGGTIAAGGYYLVQLAGGAVGAALPTPDATGTVNMSGTAGKIALVNDNVLLPVATCPSAASIVDFVGFGTTPNCYEGTGPTGAPSTTNAVLRKSQGCQDTNDNASDFSVLAVAPRNSSTAAYACPCAKGF